MGLQIVGMEKMKPIVLQVVEKISTFRAHSYFDFQIIDVTDCPGCVDGIICQCLEV